MTIAFVVVVVAAVAGKMLMIHAGLDSNTTFVLPLLPPAAYDAGLLHAVRVMTLRRLRHASGVTSECAELFDVIVKRQPHVVMVEEEGGGSGCALAVRQCRCHHQRRRRMASSSACMIST
jgi:hypothetical protein